MLFNSVNFLFFFLAVYTVYNFLTHRAQNRFLLIASYIFYGSWDWRFIPLLFFSSWLSYYSGKKIYEATKAEEKRNYLKLTLIGEVGLLAIFKYFNFFVENVISLLATIGVRGADTSIKIILPLGISYYTFQAIAYSVDVYRGKIKACQNLWDFLLFKSFFPILFSGPIERANNLLVQVENKRVLTAGHIEQGAYLFAWGLFKKVYVADNVAGIVNSSFANSSALNGAETWLAAYAFAIQLYCDFSGYTDMARGLAKFFGFSLVPNFNLPYFASNPVDFWKRWHMSLSNWFGDYVLTPLFFWTKSSLISLFITMFLVGIWHGASWNFVALGLYNATILCTYVVIAQHLRFFLYPKSLQLRKGVRIFSIFLMFHVTCVNLIFFRSQSLGQIWELLGNLLSKSYLLTGSSPDQAIQLIFFTAPLFLMKAGQVWFRDLEFFLKLPKKIQFAASMTAVLLVLMVFLLTSGTKTGDFIYFQF
jgi:alginate O-acetyltransferase complex protein AlgI